MPITEGKTKKVIPILAARLVAKDDITAGDGKKHDLLPGKGELATRTTSNVFELLRYCGLPVAYIAQDSPTSFVGYHCSMIPIEVVVRREAHGSFLKRLPAFTRGHRFEKPVVEYYLKTKGRRFGRQELPCDDPMMIIKDKRVQLYDPAKPLAESEPILAFTEDELFGHFDQMREDAEDWSFSIDELAPVAVQAFLILEDAWRRLDRKLVDFKLEFGLTGDYYNLYIADVIDNDSWRLMQGDEYVDKQVYRDGGDLEKVLKNYRRVADMTGQMRSMRASVKSAMVGIAPVFENGYRLP